MDKKIDDEAIEELYEAIVCIENKRECELFLEDLLTVQELHSLASRLKTAKLLSKGETYLEVTEKTHVSSTTLARVNKCLKYGKGYNEILEKINK